MNVLLTIYAKSHNEFEMANEFIQSNYLGIYNKQDDKLKTITIDDILNAKSKINFTQFLSDNHIQAVISGSFTPMSAKLFYENKISLLLANGNNILDNIDAYLKGHLTEYSNVQPAYASCAPSGCSSCAVSCK